MSSSSLDNTFPDESQKNHTSRRSWRPLVALALGLCGAHLSQAATINSSTPYLNGANVPWNEFGVDFGLHPTWPPKYSGTFFNNTFASMKAAGINSARIWVHCDGRASPEFNAAGDVTGLDSEFINNLSDMLDKANANGIKIQLCLWSFDMLNNNLSGAGPAAGMHASLITNPSYRSNYITKALNPMLDAIASKPALAVIEIINEPEWGIAETPATTTQSVTKAQMQAFVSALTTAIHAKTSKNVTVGSASIKWSTANGLDATVGDWWAGLGLDHRDVHYYEWMTGTGYNYDPFKAGHTPSYYQWNVPAVIGEFGGNGNAPYSSVSAMMEASWNNGYAGHHPWSFQGGDGEGKFDDFKAASLSFANAHLGAGGTIAYSFEGSTQNWGFKFGTGSVATSTAQHQGSGTSSLRVTFNNSQDAGVGVDSPSASLAGKTLTFWVWVPNQTAVNGLFAFVQYGSGWTWTQGATKTNASLTKNGWNALTVTAPAGQTIQRIGVGFDFVSTYSGSFYIDSVTY